MGQEITRKVGLEVYGRQKTDQVIHTQARRHKPGVGIPSPGVTLSLFRGVFIITTKLKQLEP